MSVLNPFMTMTPSLHRDLHQQVPSSWRIRLQNWFSFLPGIKPVDPRVVTLRKKLNQAHDFQYLDYYHCHADYFNRRFKNKAFKHSSPETNYLVKAYPPPPLIDPAFAVLGSGSVNEAASEHFNDDEMQAESITPPETLDWIVTEADASQTASPSQSAAF
ncbi:hypothetical protein [Legionella taurinensis]|nr:hypothetical protein [Legionella taurinensis]MDX1837482.1 hypothetical protein [Legionella taurinensis]